MGLWLWCEFGDALLCVLKCTERFKWSAEGACDGDRKRDGLIEGSDGGDVKRKREREIMTMVVV